MMDLDLIKEQFKEVLCYSQGIEEPKIEEIFEKWEKSKSYFIKECFKGELIYELPEKVSFTLADRDKERRYSEFVEEVAYLGEFNWDDDFISFLSFVGYEDFYNNCLSRVYKKGDKIIHKGSKIIKSFKHFITEEKLLSEIQNKASMIIQENKIEGYLCFSVHPLDFLSSSENNHNWRSCHSLDGDYRAGNLSYMCDKSTMMVYLRSEDQAILPHFPSSVPWNNKRWRCLLHFNTDYRIIFAGRQYPFNTPEALDIIHNALTTSILPKVLNWYGEAQWSYWHNDQIKQFKYANGKDNNFNNIADYCSYVVINNRIYDINDIVKDNFSEGLKPLHYNDLTRSSVYSEPYYMFLHAFMGKESKFKIGSDIKCIHCGETYISSFDTMMCTDCEVEFGNSMNSDEYPVCDCCGQRFYHRDGAWVDEGSHICSSCLERETFICEKCGVIHYNSEKVYDKKEDRFICTDCAEER